METWLHSIVTLIYLTVTVAVTVTLIYLTVSVTVTVTMT